MAQQTAVDWLWNVLADKGYFKKLPISEIKQAKQKEKEQIVDAHYQGYRNDIGTTEISEQYYNETFTSTQQGENPSATRIGQF